MSAATLETSLGYEFKQKELLELALTHRSHSGRHNERLEFLGDSVLNCAVAFLLFERFNKIDEGDLSRLRANLVKQASLADIAQRLEVARFLRLGEGELKSGGFRRPSILADTLEALFGAVMLDGGFDAARAVITRLYTPILETVDPKTLGKDAKTLLQEYLQGRKIPLPIYTVVATHGAAHNQEFEVECGIPKLEIQVIGTGGSRRAAEQAAAKKALEAAMASNPAPAKRTSRARKQAQLTLPVATIQSPDAPDAAGKSKEPAPKREAPPRESEKEPTGSEAPGPELLAREPSAKELTAKAPASKEPSKEGTPKEPGPREPVAKETASKEGASRETASKEGSSKDAPLKEPASREIGGKDAASKDGASKDVQSSAKEAPAKEAAAKDGTAKEGAAAKDGAAVKEGGAKDTAVKEGAAKDGGREAGAKELAPKEPTAKAAG